MDLTPPKRPSRGFTLIELMITVAVVAVLASVAYPAYSSYIRKGKRATAQAALMDIASREQSYLLDRRVYVGGATALTALNFTTPAEISGAYTITVECSPADCTGFIARANRINAQLVSGELNMSITNTGAKEPSNTPGYWGR